MTDPERELLHALADMVEAYDAAAVGRQRPAAYREACRLLARHAQQPEPPTPTEPNAKPQK